MIVQKPLIVPHAEESDRIIRIELIPKFARTEFWEFVQKLKRGAADIEIKEKEEDNGLRFREIMGHLAASGR